MTAKEVSARLRSGPATREDSDAVLLAGGYRFDPKNGPGDVAFWTAPNGNLFQDTLQPDPAHNLQDGADMVKASGFEWCAGRGNTGEGVKSFAFVGTAGEDASNFSHPDFAPAQCLMIAFMDEMAAQETGE